MGYRVALALACIGLALGFCAAGWQKAEAPVAPTFYKDVLPVLQDHCHGCHRDGAVAPMPLVTYEQTRPWAGAMAHAVEMKMMPPWFADARYGHFANDTSLTEQQIATISAWSKAGAPAGDPHDAPAARKWASWWAVARLGLCWIPRQEAEFGALMSGVGDGSGHRRVSVILTRQNHEEPFQ